MSLQFAVFNKCRACLTPETVVEFIHLAGSKAEMFKVITGIELPIESDKMDAMICPECFSALERSYNFKITSKKAEIFFELKRSLAPVLQNYNEAVEAAKAAAAEAVQSSNQSSVKRFLRTRRGKYEVASDIKFHCETCQPKCKRKFSSFRALKTHQTTQERRRQGIYPTETGSEKKFGCNKCTKTYGRRSNLRKHLKITHWHVARRRVF